MTKTDGKPIPCVCQKPLAEGEDLRVIRTDEGICCEKCHRVISPDSSLVWFKIRR
jgi:hypothetical protein